MVPETDKYGDMVTDFDKSGTKFCCVPSPLKWSMI